MSRILALSLETADGPQRAIMEKTLSEVGYLSGTRRLLMVDPNLMAGKQLYDYLNLRPESPFTRVQREMVATMVYGMIGAKPCLSTHCEAVRLRPAIDRLARPHHDQDIASLREAGWDDRAIYEATALIAVFNFIGRFEAASGLPMDEIPADADIPEARPDGRSDDLLAATG